MILRMFDDFFNGFLMILRMFDDFYGFLMIFMDVWWFLWMFGDLFNGFMPDTAMSENMVYHLAAANTLNIVGVSMAGWGFTSPLGLCKCLLRTMSKHLQRGKP